MSRDPAEWEEQDLQSLIGLPESLTLEFKSKRLLDDLNKAKDALTRECSAFANSSGGTIVIGIEEGKQEGQRVAQTVDGIDAKTAMAADRLQQLIAGNLSPTLPGLRVRRVRLAEDKVAFVIKVPPGSTAHQASDYRYYGRSEFEARALQDHDVRLRMQRGRVPRAELVVVSVARQATASYAVGLGLENSGEITIRDCAGTIDFTCAPGRGLMLPGRPSDQLKFRLNTGRLVRSAGAPAYVPGDQKIFPGESFAIPSATIILSGGDAFKEGDFLAEYTLYLDDALPSQGKLDLGLACAEQLAKA